MTANCGTGSALAQDLELPLLGTSAVVATAHALSCRICVFLVCVEDGDEGEKRAEGCNTAGF